MSKCSFLLSCCGLVGLTANANASLTLLTGPPVATHVGNLVTNGSFETGAPAPGSANYVYWATGTTNTPFAPIPSWNSLGTAFNYALWGADNAVSPFTTESSDVLP